MRHSTALGIMLYLVIMSAIIYTAVDDGGKKNILLILGKEANETVKKALMLDKETFNFYTDISKLNECDAIVLFGSNFTQDILSWISLGGRAFYIPTYTSQHDEGLKQLGEFVLNTTEVELVPNETIDKPIVKNLNWISAPRVSKWLQFTKIYYDVEVYVFCRGVGAVFEEPKPFLFVIRYGSGRIYFLSAILASGENEYFIQWPYFNYLLYVILTDMTGIPAKTYDEWPYSPVPHKREKLFFLIWPLILTAISFTAFYFVKAYCRRHPLKEEDVKSLIIREEEGLSKWEEAGLHKQLSGLFWKWIIQFFLLPFTLVWSIIWIRVIIKYPMAFGITGWITLFTQFIWAVFDFGTSQAAVKYFSEYRIKDLVHSVKYIQFFVWWQFLTGIVQVALVTNIAAWFLVKSELSYMAWVLIFMSLAQYPGFWLFTDLVLKGMQKLDWDEILVNVTNGLISPVVSGFVTYYVREYVLANNIIIGKMLATCIGVQIGTYVGTWVGLLVWLIFFKAKKIPIIVFLRADFNWNVAKKSLFYGGKFLVGDLSIIIAWSLEAWLVAKYIPNFTEWWAFFTVVWNQFGFCMMVCDMVQKVMPAISEADGYNLKKLVEYYFIESWIFTNILVFIIVFATIAISKVSIIGFYGTTWWPAVMLLPWVGIFFYLSPPAWVNDQIQLGTNRPELRTVVTIFEQVLRIILMIILVVFWRLGIWGAVISYNLALLGKDILTNILTRKYIVKFKMYWWNVYIAPTLAALAVYFPADFIVSAIWNRYAIPNPEAPMVIFGLEVPKGIFVSTAAALACLVLIPVFVFLIGFLYAVDPNMFEDLKKSMLLAGKFDKFYLLVGIPWAYDIGARISPFKRFEVDIYYEAKKEMEKLNEIKAKIA